MTEILDRISNLSPEKRRLLLLRLEGQRQDALHSPIRRADRSAALPMSFSQQRLWFLDQLEPGTAVYNLPAGLRLEGPLDVAALARSLRELVRRHEVLRTVYGVEDGRGVQRIRHHAATELTELPLVDLTGLPPGERRPAGSRIAEEQARRPFDLACGPVIRALLLRLAADDHTLVLVIHHIATDGWSTGILSREMASLYESFSRGEAPALPELPVQYADFAVWQRGWLSGEVLERQLAFWRQHLAGAHPVLDLPLDRPRPREQTFRGSACSVLLSPSLTSALQSLGLRAGATLFEILLAGFAALLRRYSGQEDVVVGVPVANRRHDEVEGLIGFFVNTLALRTRLDGDPSFAELLLQVRDRTRAAFEHQDLPFELVVDDLRPERTLSTTPLFQVMLVLQNTPQELVAFHGLTWSPVSLSPGTSRFDLTLEVSPAADRLRAAIEYNADLFDGTRIRRLLGHLGTLLAGAGAEPGRAVSTLPLLDEPERHQVLIEWDGGPVPATASALLHEAFAARVRRQPEAPALIAGSDRLTGRELARRANGLARRLAALGAGPETPVGICCGRSAAMVAGVLAVLASGGAYVPLDPRYPAQRLAFMLADSRARAVLADEEGRRSLPPFAGPVLSLDEEWDADAPPPNRATGENLAYLIYTSGSTGTPKGVAVRHAAAVALVEWARGAFAPGELAGTLASTSLSFDLSVFELFVPLASGGTVILAANALELPALPARSQVTLINTVPSAMDELLRLRGVPDSVRTVNLAGEALTGRLVERIFAETAVERVVNLYGPSEDTTYSTWTDRCRDGSSPAIGRPVAGTRACLLAGPLEPVPAGVPGELCLAGAGLARGYAGRPDLTAERFLPDPFGPEPGGRLYRTGDLARHRPDGNLEFLGRLDRQVKVRGYRIELGEVEAALARCPGVREAAVLARADGEGPRRLVAYLVPSGGAAPSPAELRSLLGAHLPEHMIPAVFLTLDALPLSPNGKVDRKALPAPDGTRPDLSPTFVTPRNEMESRLAAIWSAVLGVQSVGVYDNFFELGGDSILSIQIVSRAAQEGLRLTPKQVFEHQTVARLAAVAGTGSTAAPEPGEVSGEVPLTPIQRWFFAQELPDPHHFNQALLLGLARDPGPARLAAALRAVLAHHDALRLRFAPAPEGWRQEHAPPGGGVPLLDVDLSALPSGRRRAALEHAAADLQGSLDLGSAPLLRAALLRLGEAGLRLFVAAHHLVVDGVSWRILLDDLQRACEQLEQGLAPRLPAKTTSFRRWAEHLVELAPRLRGELDHWLEAGRAEVRALPVDRPGARNLVGGSATLPVDLDEEETQSLLTEVPRVYRAGVEDALLTALADALARWTGAPRALVDLEGHGREEEAVPGVDLSRTVGWLTTLFPVLLELPRGGSAGDALREVKERLRAVPRRGLGYGLLRFLDAGSAAALRSLPQAQVSFNYLGQLDRGLATASLFAAAPESSGPALSARQPRPYLLEVVARVAERRLRVVWTYGDAHHRETVDRLAGSFLLSLRALIEHCRSAAPSCTPSDFPLAALDQATLDRLAAGGEIEDVYPLAPTQHGMLFFHLYAPESPAYFQQLTWTLRGPLDAAALRRAWERQLARHPVLRTAFVAEGLERPLQVVRRKVELPWRELDWRGVSEAEARVRVGELLADDRRAGLDPSRAPVLRVALIRLADEVHQVVWSYHHMLLDGWCLPRLIGEGMTLYEAEHRGEEPRLEPSRPYRDYIEWLQAQDLGAAESFWRRTLAGFRAPNRLGVDRSPGSLPSQRSDYGGCGLLLPAGLSASLQVLAHHHQLTLNTLVQGAWALLLSCFSGERDVVFGVTSSGRPPELTGVEAMVGLFITTLPLRVQMSPEEGLAAGLQKLQAQQVEQRQYEYTPLVLVQSWSEVPGDQPLFDTFLIYQNYPSLAAPASPGEVQMTQTGVFERTSYPLALFVVPAREVSIALSFDRERFAEVDARRMLAHLASLFAAMAEDPGRPLAAIPRLSEPERHQLLVEGNDTALPLPEELAAHRLFAAQAGRTPDAVAAVCGEARWTYRELESRAGRGAARLAAAGAGPGSIVALLTDRGLDLLAAVLAAFKAGAAYLPLDPSHPETRLADVLARSGAAVLVAAAAHSEKADRALQRIAADARPGLLFLPDLLADGGAPEPASRPGSPNDLAYVIYTSGSTGVPKGAMIEHRGLVNHLAAKIADLGLGAGDCVAQTASQCFDISVWQMLAALGVGGRVEILPDEIAHDPLRLLAAVEERGVTILETVPSLLRILLDEVERQPEPPRPSTLRWLIPTGEALLPDLCRRWAERYPGVRLMNAYGPTECSDDVSHFPVPEPFETARAQVPIGRPVANTRLYVADPQLAAVPPGVPGELLVGGAGVGRGYLGEPARTAEVFVPDPWGPEPGGRLYRTGDLARRLADGNLEFLGRIDHQVKLRGLRIELGEIEAVLAQHPGVRQAVAAVLGGARLAAYVVADPEAGVTAAALQEFLRGQVPEAMVPADVVLLDSLPLTANGKVDRKALPVPERAGASAEIVAATPSEELLAAIWGEVLGVDRVGVHDNFFDLGGHSLTAIQVVSRIRQAFGVEIALRSVFERPTVAALAQLLSREMRESPSVEEPPIVPVPRDGHLPLSFAQQRLWFLDQLEPGMTDYNVPTGMILGADLDVAALERAFGEVVRRHESLRTTFRSVAGEPHQVISPPQPFPLPVIDLSALPPAAGERQARKLLEVQYAFDLERGPLMRAGLLALEGRRLLAVSLHHIVTDGWSMDILVRELAALYEAFSRGLPSPLPDLPVQYADYAAWQRQWLQGPVLEAQVSYWRQQLAGAPPLLDLPIDRPRPPRQTFRGARQRLDLPGDLRERLRRFGRQEGMTPFMVLLAALQALLYRHTAEEDLSVGTFTANRDRVEIEGLVGFFVNTLVLRSRVSGGAGFSALLRQVREVTLGAHAHQDLPFEKLIEELRPPRNLSHTPLFQVMLEFQNLSPVPREQSGVQRSSGREELSRANFDLTLRVIQQGDDLSLTFSYNRDLFDGPTIARMLGHYERLLESAVTDPERPLGELPVAGEAELHQVVCEWSRHPAARSAGEPVHLRLAVRAAADPAALASVAGERRLTYGELDRNANRLAHTLRAMGVGLESPVGLCADRSPEMLIGLLGILKAGGAYVPLDPAYPRERLAFMVAASGARVLVTQRRWSDRLPVDPERVLLDDLEELGPGEAGEAGEQRSEPAVGPDHLAYLIFTSGSTGRPKAVAVSHGSLERYVAFVGEELALAPGDRVLQFASISFDTAAEEIFPCLSRGATLVLRSDEMLGSPAAFLERCDVWGVTVLDLPTAYWSELAAALDTGEASLPSAVRAVVIGGEKASADRVAAWRRGAGKACRLINTYGPTEATIVATTCELSPAGDAGFTGEVPIGRPVPHARVYVVDADRRPVPIGASGELLLGGQGLARGYFGRPGLTAERFVPDPFSGEPGARLYRSGDRVRTRRDGQLEFLGRVDRQVKVRGFRIEPGEIEEALLRHPALQAAAVAAWPDPSGGLRLAAYVVPAAGAAAPGVAELRSFLKDHLPEHMLPAVFVALEKLPLTPSGKVDRGALPAPDASRPSLAREIVPPSTPIEEALAEIWREVLKTGEIGVQDNFFELGGHSLLATQVLARIRDRLHIDLPLIILFEMPTIEELALAFEEALLDRIERLGEDADAESLLLGGLGG
jgi:amino acid adenylation domain-containing protein/non-ribosomal peptide synthase protein (TIGR01720 family)